MAINPENVKLYESQVLTDEDDGGGRATGVEIVDGQINNLFPDISRLDRTLGDVALRKAFLGIDTDNADVYLGAHAIIVEPPADPNVSVVMFDAGSEDDERLNAQNRIESYVVKGSAAQFDLLGNQYEGQRAIVAIQREEQPAPEVGDVFLLEDSDTGNAQYIRITEVDAQVQTFTALVSGNLVDFQRRRLDLGISATLEHTFPGGDARPEGPADPHSDIFSTEVADAARYWGVTKAADPVTTGDVQVKVDSIYASLVPSAQAESPIVDAPFYQSPVDVRDAAAADLTDTFELNYVSGTSVLGYLPRPAVRGSVSLSISGSVYTDGGAGVLVRSSGSAPFSQLRINYGTGAVEGQRDSGSGSGTLTGSATFRPGAPTSGRRASESIEITINNRGYNYVETFPGDKPRPGTMVISYRALGKWYTVADRGDGVLEGTGSGSIDSTTGTVAVTLEALPDVGSELILEYVVGIADQFAERSGSLATTGEIEVSIGAGASPGTVVVTYTAGGVEYTLDDTATVGVLAGDGEGSVDYGQGIVKLRPDLTPDDGTTVDVDFDTAGAETYTITSPSVAGNTLSGTIPGAPLKPGSVSIRCNVEADAGSRGKFTRLRVVRDDGAGGFLGFIGTIDYSTGAFSVEITLDYETYQFSYYVYTWSNINGGDSVRFTGSRSVTRNEALVGSVFINYTEASTPASAGSVSVAAPSVSISLIDGDLSSLIPGSLLFDWGGNRYYDRDGIVYTDFDSATGAGTEVGAVDYKTKSVTLDAWPEGAAPGVTIVAATTTDAELATDGVVFRTSGAPLRPSSLSVTVTDSEGNLISESAAIDGSITGAAVDGSVNVQTGVVKLQFTDGTDPIEVLPETGRYSAILVSFLPLDAELIGLDPVRLPSDGRVPVFREGDVIVLSHTAETDIGTPTAGDVETLARDGQASIVVVDSAGVELDPAMYTANRSAGTVTFADPLTLQDADLNALTAPLTIRDRVEHMSVVNDVQITGELSFIAPCGHDMPATETVVSSAKVWGDINSRVFNFFTQRTWNSGSPNWTDDRIGDDTTANYNIVDNPIEYANNGAITEKWALVFTSSTSFNIVGQTLGIIGTGNTSVDVAPENPNTGNPYFVMRAAGFGSGWAAGNVIRFDTEGCLAPVWIARTVLSGAATEDDDQFVLQVRGDAD